MKKYLILKNSNDNLYFTNDCNDYWTNDINSAYRYDDNFNFENIRFGGYGDPFNEVLTLEVVTIFSKID